MVKTNNTIPIKGREHGEEKGSWRKNIKIRKEVKEEDIGEKKRRKRKWMKVKRR